MQRSSLGTALTDVTSWYSVVQCFKINLSPKTVKPCWHSVVPKLLILPRVPLGTAVDTAMLPLSPCPPVTVHVLSGAAPPE